MSKFFMLCVALLIASCASSNVKRNPEKTNEVMITFVNAAQSGFWREAMENVTPEEKENMMSGGQVLPEYKDAVNRIRLSTISSMDLNLDSKGRLVGLIDILDEANSLYQANDEKVQIDKSKLEDLSTKRQKESSEETQEELAEEGDERTAEQTEEE